MFTDFAPMRRSLFTERVNSFLGVTFLACFALWASLIIWNFTTGNNPIDRAIAGAIDRSVVEQ